MKPTQALFLLLLTLAACRVEEKPRAVRLADLPAVALRAAVVPTEEELLAPRKVFALGECLALYESKQPVGFLRFVDKRSGRLLAVYGNIGRAEDEFQQPNVFASGSGLLITSVGDRLTEVHFRDGEAAWRTIPLVADAATRVRGANYAALVGGGVVAIHSPSSSDRLLFLHPDGSCAAWNDYPIEIPEAVDPFFRKEVILRTSYACSPALGRLFAAGQYVPVVETIDPDRPAAASAVRLQDVGENRCTVRDGIPTYDDPVLFYTFACATPRHFYALYQGARRADMPKGRSEVHRFDAEGRPVRRYLLDRRIYHFSVEADDATIYALGMNDDLLPTLYVYELPR